MFRSSLPFPLTAVFIAAAIFARPVRLFAVSWNATDPTYSAVSVNGLTDMPTLFANSRVVNNGAISVRGTGTYLGDGWVLTAQHVIQGTGGYGTLPAASSITMGVTIGG